MDPIIWTVGIQWQCDRYHHMIAINDHAITLKYTNIDVNIEGFLEAAGIHLKMNLGYQGLCSSVEGIYVLQYISFMLSIYVLNVSAAEHLNRQADPMVSLLV